MADRGKGTGAAGMDEKARQRLAKLQKSMGAVRKSAFLHTAKSQQKKGRTLTEADITVSVVDPQPGGTATAFGRAEVIVMDSGNDPDKIMLGDFDDTDRIIHMGDKDPADKTWTVDKDLGGDQP